MTIILNNHKSKNWRLLKGQLKQICQQFAQPKNKTREKFCDFAKITYIYPLQWWKRCIVRDNLEDCADYRFSAVI